MKDFEQMRLLAKRAGKLTRVIEIDKKETKRDSPKNNRQLREASDSE